MRKIPFPDREPDPRAPGDGRVVGVIAAMMSMLLVVGTLAMVFWGAAAHGMEVGPPTVGDVLLERVDDLRSLVVFGLTVCFGAWLMILWAYISCIEKLDSARNSLVLVRDARSKLSIQCNHFESECERLEKELCDLKEDTPTRGANGQFVKREDKA